MSICTEDQTTWQHIAILALQISQMATYLLLHSKIKRPSDDATPTVNKNNKSN